MPILRPGRGHVLVLPDEEDRTMGGGLLRHPDWTPITFSGRVMAVGSNGPVYRDNGSVLVQNIQADVVAGERIHWPKDLMGTELRVGDQLIRLFSFDEIEQCIVEENPNA